ncbi:MAG: ABC transporter permease [Saprospiraceae bacterium]|nr:ABC transporter permease [Saprospiraceae bacterium]
MIGKIAWKNILHKPLSTALSVSLLMFSVGIITLLLLMQHQLEHKFQNDLRNIDLVLGAKGSPLQLVLSAVYHLDAPTGNIKMAEAKSIMQNPMVEQAVPLAYGDSYRSFRILGTTEDYLKKYDAQLLEGRVFQKSMEAVLGANVAKAEGLKLGDTFIGTHGEAEGGHEHEEHPYNVVGILEKTNSVLDNLVLTNVESVWQVHEEHAHEEEPTAEDPHATSLDFDHNHPDHDHAHDHDHSKEVITADSMELTAVLLKYKNRLAMLNMPRIINQETKMQAVLPALEINRLFYMLGIGATTLKLIAGGIMLMSGFSVFFVLYSRLRERKYELALLRSVGYRPGQLFRLLLLEGLLLSGLGYLLGVALSRLGLWLVNRQAAGDFHIKFLGNFIPAEGWLLLLTLGVGTVAALLPAWKAMQVNVSTALSEG